MVHSPGASPPRCPFCSNEQPHTHLQDDHSNNNDASSIDSLYYENYLADKKGNITLEKLNELPSPNLKPTIPSSFISSVENTLSQQQSRTRNSGRGAVGSPRKSDVASSQQEKLKASKFSATLVRIGTWERAARHEGHLVAKCYYAKKKLMWEFLESTLKRKIEILWSEISAIRATIQENEPGILEIELNRPPSFHLENDPQPRKPTSWNSISDFTDGQALLRRRHYLEFLPGVLDKPYEKLLQCDRRLFELSQQPFPSSQNPCFNFNPRIYDPAYYTILSLSLHGRPHFNPGLHYSLAHNPTSFVPGQVSSYRPTIQPHFNSRELAFPNSAEAVNHQYAENPRRAFWGQRLYSSADTLAIEQVQRQMSIPSAIPAAYYQNNNNNYIGGGRGLGTEMLALMTDSQVVHAAPLDALQCPSSEGNLALNTDANHNIYGNDVHAAMQYYKYSDNTGIVYPHPARSLVFPQVPEEISQPDFRLPRQIPIEQPRDNSGRDVDSPDSAESVTHQYAENPMKAFRGQGLNSSADTSAIEQVQGQRFIPSAIPAAVYSQNNNNNNYIEGGSWHDLDTQTFLRVIENTLMSDSQVEHAASLDALLGPSSEGNLALNTDANHNNYGNDVHADMQYYKDSDNTRIVCPHPAAGSSVFSQVPEEISQPVSGLPRQNIPMKQPRDNSSSSTMVDDATDNDDINEVNSWFC